MFIFSKIFLLSEAKFLGLYSSRGQVTILEEVPVRGQHHLHLHDYHITTGHGQNIVTKFNDEL